LHVIVPQANAAATRHAAPVGTEQRRARLKQLNLVGPAGLVSMEDGCVGGFVQRGVATAGEGSALVQMGGEASVSTDTRATEASVRGFWRAWRKHMDV
jgi:anthranilate 1,2-dioxygenase large subunit/terephthalate 1,2-dioxygenase oxygenase component alpha subunit